MVFRWFVALLICWFVGFLDCGYVGTLVCWLVRLLFLCSFGHFYFVRLKIPTVRKRFQKFKVESKVESKAESTAEVFVNGQ